MPEKDQRSPRIVISPARATDVHHFYCTDCGERILIIYGTEFCYCTSCGYPHAVGWPEDPWK